MDDDCTCHLDRRRGDIYYSAFYRDCEGDGDCQCVHVYSDHSMLSGVHLTAAIWTMVVAAVPSISIICYKGIYKGQPVFFEVFIVTAAVTLLLGIVFGCIGKADPAEVRLRERFY